MTSSLGRTTDTEVQADIDLVGDLRIGRIGFLNVLPMHWDMPVASVRTDVPSALNKAIVAGEIDATCMSSIEYARHADELVLLPSLCISSHGAVGSVFAIGNCQLEDAARIAVTSASDTSVVLVEALARLRGGAPEIVQLDGPVADVIADGRTVALLIGDEAMRAHSDPTLAGATFTDLGERWYAETGLPMVFAVWAIRREVVEANPERAAALDRLLVRSVRTFSAHPGAIESVAAEQGMQELTVRTYFDRLCYAFGRDERKGLLRFLRMAHEDGRLTTVPVPQFAGAPAGPATDDGDSFGAHGAEALAGLLGADAPSSTDRPGDDAERERLEQMYTKSVGTSAALKPREADIASGEFWIEQEHEARSLDVDDVLTRALRGERISDLDALALLQSPRLNDLGQVANELRMRKTDPDVITFVVDRNINYTNVCVTDCGFCAFYRKPGDTVDSYLLPNDVILEKIQETIDLTGTAALLQGGHHPDLDIEYYVTMFRAVKERFPTFHLHALSPPEIQHIARRSKMSVVDVLTNLRDAGMDSLPGGGGEILTDRVRRIIAPKKTKADDWLDIMEAAQRLGMSTTASMMYGHADLLGDRVEHMRRVRELQDRTGGFRAFISWTFQPGNTPLSQLLDAGLVPHAEHLPIKPTPFDYLRTQAVSRIYLDNMANIQSSWVTQGMKIGQAALYYGANDLGSIMIEENVVSSAGTTYRASVEDFVQAIRATGKRPIQRDTLYRTVKDHSLD